MSPKHLGPVTPSTLDCPQLSRHVVGGLLRHSFVFKVKNIPKPGSEPPNDLVEVTLFDPDAKE